MRSDSMKAQARPTFAAGTRPDLARSAKVVLWTRSSAAASTRLRMRSGAWIIAGCTRTYRNERLERCTTAQAWRPDCCP